MLQLFLKKDGAISVFLSVILLPVLLVGFLTVDAAKMIMSKVVVSDAGEMAMNAALSQYDFQLKDEYGLLVMEKTPEDMNEELEKYFLQSLNGTGIDGAQNYDKILHLTNESFKALNIEASKIYKTEVEKQQILEYMKYRAPVCIAESLVKKVGEIKETGKMVKAIEKEIDFSEDMEDCQSIFESTKIVLDELNKKLKPIQSISLIQSCVDEIQSSYVDKLIKALLITEILNRYSGYDENKITQKEWTDYEEVAKEFIKYARGAMENEIISSKFYDNCKIALNYRNTIEKMGGIDGLLTEFNKSDQKDQEDTKRELELLKSNYESCENNFETYIGKLESESKEIIDRAYGTLCRLSTQTLECNVACQKAIDSLEDLKKKLSKASQSYGEWEESVNNLEKPGDMADEVEQYRDIFNIDSLDRLIAKIKDNKNKVDVMEDEINGETFYNQSISSVSPAKQYNTYDSEIKKVANSIGDCSFFDIEKKQRECSAQYNHVTISVENIISIEEDECYKQIKENCKKETEKDPKKVEEANNQLKKGKEESDQALEKLEQFSFDWNNAGKPLPSRITGGGSIGLEGTSGMAGGNIDDKNSRKNIIQEMKESIQQASNFFDSLSGIITKNLENLYIAEYAMQLFSYYTVNKSVSVEKNHTQKVKALEEGQVFGMSGYQLSKHPGYPLEVEYILWGEDISADNMIKTISAIYGIRLLFNSIFAFTNKDINVQAETIAYGIAGGAPYLVPIIKIVYKFSLAALESAYDIIKIKDGYGVAIMKQKDTWSLLGGDNTSGKFTFNYEEYLRCFINLSLMLKGKEGILGRIADCIQVNTDKDKNIIDMYTMVGIEAKVKTQTTFMKKIAEYSNYQEKVTDSYNILYQSVLGY